MNIFYLNIEQLRKQGVRISIDDFGTGLSNLKRFYEINPDSIKSGLTIYRRYFRYCGKKLCALFSIWHAITGSR
ncbi:EAL domain-containing protein [Escherichia coli]|nr:EAL domain-containing protein [Escherichia coli]